MVMWRDGQLEILKRFSGMAPEPGDPGNPPPTDPPPTDPGGK
jgi:hypothetical protein